MSNPWLQLRKIGKIRIGNDFISDGRHQRIITFFDLDDKQIFQITATGGNDKKYMPCIKED